MACHRALERLELRRLPMGGKRLYSQVTVQELVQILPPETASSSAVVRSIRPAGCSGSRARSAALRLWRKSSSFHARMIFSTDIMHSSLGRGKARGIPRPPYPRCWLRRMQVGVTPRYPAKDLAARLREAPPGRGVLSAPRRG